MSIKDGGKYLREAVESILAQTFTDFEFIIINDGSTDQTAKILDGYTDPRIVRLKNEKNVGLAASLNKGIAVARGDYIARMDADDICAPDRLKAQFNYLEKHTKVDVLGGAIEIMDRNGMVLSSLKFPETNPVIQWSFCYYCPIVHPAVMVRRQVLLDAGGYRNVWPHAEDYDLWVRISKNAHFANLSQVLLKLRKHETNITVLNVDKNLESSAQISREYVSRLLDKKVSLEVIEILWNQQVGQPDQVQQAVKLIDDLYLYFLSNTLLKRSERNYIRKETSRRLIQLSSGFVRSFGVWTIIKSAAHYDLYAVLHYLPRYLWRSLKEFVRG